MTTMTRVELGRAILYATSKDAEGKPYALHADEIRGLAEEVLRLTTIVDEVHSWAVYACIASPSDMAQNFPRIVEITAPPEP